MYLSEPVVVIEEHVSQQSEEKGSNTPPHKKTANKEEPPGASPEEEKSNPLDADEGVPKESENEEPPRESGASRAETPHDESDFEDNIIVTVPKPQTHTHSYHDYRDRQNMNGRYHRTSNLNEVEAPSNQSQSHQVSLHRRLNQFLFLRMKLLPNLTT